MRKRHSLFPALAVMLLMAGPLRAASETPAPTKARPGSSSHLLNLALLVAGNKPGDAGEALPAAVAKAVADIRDFLPFKSYRMVDSALVRTVGNEIVSLELQGPDSVRYRAHLAYQDLGDNRLNFTKFEVLQLADSFGRAPGNPAPPRPDSAPAQAPEAPPAPREVISTGFGINVGETIVVGTSRLRGSDGALLVVLTALPGK